MIPTGDRSSRPVPLARRILLAALALAACNLTGRMDATPSPPSETPTPTHGLRLPTPDCVHNMTVLGESGYLDATPVEASGILERTWHVRNTGTCEWTTGYALISVEGESFGLDPVPLPAPVAPGEETDLRIRLTAPSSPGLHAGGWALRTPEGATLGAGSRPLRIRVNSGSAPGDSSTVVYNLADEMCAARWVAASPSRSGRLLPCPGYDRDRGGSVTQDSAPRFSNGALDDELALILHPPHEEGGLLSGTYPPYVVQRGDQFRVILGCSAGSPGCAARFQLNIRQGDQLLPLAEWLVTEADPPRNLVVDLAFLAGQSVEFVLGVDADGPGAADATIWLQPRIVH